LSLRIVSWVAGAFALVAAIGPWDMKLFPSTAAPDASGQARLVYAASPFGVAVTADGRGRYDIQVKAAGLPAPSTVGSGFRAYVAWVATPDLAQWRRVGTITNGKSTVGPAEFNKFLFVVTAESSATPAAHHGPTILHGNSPSAWLQNFMTHPLFRGPSQ
jgi:hypothetical protein